jgi:Glycosyl hydrolase catalytic core
MFTLSLLAASVGCGTSDGNSNPGSGATGAAGPLGTAGLGASGASASGGSSSAAGGTTGSGGAVSTGGQASAGAPAASGAPGSGGTNASGGASNTAGAAGSHAGTSSGGTSAGGAAGTGMVPYRGVANSPCAARTALQVSWYYNWTQTANQACSSASVGGEFVPMIWGHTGNEQSATAIANSINTFVGRGNKYVLGFNEPDNTGQSNLSVATAITLWPSFNNPAISIGSPASQANTTGVAWFQNFMGQVNANAALRSDFIAMHWYGWNAGSCEPSASTLEAYLRQIEAIPGNRPIWLTEWGCLNLSAPSNAVTQAHVAGAIQMFTRHPRLVRYAWYPWAGATHTLNNTDGSLTALGAIYASAPAFH